MFSILFIYFQVHRKIDFFHLLPKIISYIPSDIYSSLLMVNIATGNVGGKAANYRREKLMNRRKLDK